MTSHAHTCDACLHRWDCDGKPGQVCAETACPVCAYAPELEPEQSSRVTLCGLCDGARERFAAAVAFGRIVTVVPCDQHRFLGEGRF